MSYCAFTHSAYNKSMDTNETTPTTRTAVEIWMSVIPTEEETLRFFEER